MEAACCNDVLFMAISGNSAPHFSTLANFVSSLGPAMGKIFAQVLAICDRQGLIGRQLFTIDGVKLPSNASKAKSGKRKEFVRQVAKMEKAVEQMLAKHRDADAVAADPQRQIERLNSEAARIREFKDHPHDRKSAKGKERLSKRTDNEWAKMATDKGVVQGYTGVAAVDEKHQIIVEAQAHGTGSQPRAAAAGGRGDPALGQGTHRGVRRVWLPQRRQLEATGRHGHRCLHPR
jgi:hypothetical protein